MRKTIIGCLSILVSLFLEWLRCWILVISTFLDLLGFCFAGITDSMAVSYWIYRLLGADAFLCLPCSFCCWDLKSVDSADPMKVVVTDFLNRDVAFAVAVDLFNPMQQDFCGLC